MENKPSIQNASQNASNHSIVSNEEIKFLELNQNIILPIQEFNYRVIFIGDSQVGKTSLIGAICGDKINKKYSKTLCCDTRSKKFKINGKIVKIKFFDLGEVDLNSNLQVIEGYLKIVHLFVYVCDTNKPRSLNIIEKVSSLNTKADSSLNFLLLNKLNDEKGEGQLQIKDKRVMSLMTTNNISNMFEVSIREKETLDVFFNLLLGNLIEYYEKEENQALYNEILKSDDMNLFFKYKPQKAKRKCYSC